MAKADEGASDEARSPRDTEIEAARREVKFTLRQKQYADAEYLRACGRFYRAVGERSDREQSSPSSPLDPGEQK